MNSSSASIECSDQPLDVAFHPNKTTLLAAALVDGTVEIHDFHELLNTGEVNIDQLDDDDEPDTIISSTAVHTQLLPSNITASGSKHASCRTLLFSRSEVSDNDVPTNAGSSGKTILYTGGTAGDLVALDAERLCTFSKESKLKHCMMWRISNASKSPINALYELSSSCLASSSGGVPLLVSGDDDGYVRIWDTRLCGNKATSSSSSVASYKNVPTGCVMSWKKHDDYISGFDQSPLEPNVLLASSSDCRISVYDVRMASNAINSQQHDDSVRLSDDIEDELLSIKVIKNGKKVVCGSANGVLNIWSYGTWGDISDRFPGHPKSVDALLKFDENTLLTGSSDGLIRVVSIHPDRMLGVLGDHDGYPIEHLQFNSDRSFVGSVTHDNIIRLWDTKVLSDDSGDEDNPDGLKTKPKLQAFTSNMLVPERDSDDDWDEMDDDAEMKDDDDDDSSNEDDAESDDNSNGRGKSKRFDRLKTDNEKFFEDL